MRSHVNRVMREAARRNERLSAYVQLLSFAMMVAIYLGIRSAIPIYSLPSILLATYGAVGALNLALAYAGVYRDWLPWLYSTMDVAIALALPLGLTQIYDIGLEDALRTPGMALIFVFLAHAALRYQPLLLLYTAFLFGAGWLALMLLVGEGDEPMRTLDLPVQVEYARMAITLLTAGILALSAARTRRLLIRATVEARSKDNLAKYLPAQVVSDMADNGIHLAEQARTQKVVVMFIDIRGFTALSEHMSPPDVAEILRDFRTRLNRVIDATGGAIDKFIGDAIMVEFGVPEPGPNDARDALICGRDLMQALDEWAEARKAAGRPVIKAGIGAHYGEVIAGAIGDELRLEYTVIGDTVNTAERIEALSHRLNVPMLVSEELFAAAGGAPDGVQCSPVEPMQVKGRDEKISLFALSLKG